MCSMMFLCGIQCAVANEAWQTAKSTHFIVYYKNAPEDFIRRLSENAESDYDRIAEEFGFTRYKFWLWDDRARIYVHDGAEEYQTATGMPAWSGGFAEPQQKVIHTFVYAQNFFETVLAHEMGHIIFREFVGYLNFAVPRWLDEGVATHQEKSQYALARPLLQNAMREGKLVPLSQLETMGPQLALSSDAARLFYLESYSAIDFLITQYCKDAFVTFCQNLRDKRNLERAIASAYPFGTFEEFDLAWQSYISK